MNRSKRFSAITCIGIRDFIDSAGRVKIIYDLTVGQPDFKVPPSMKKAVIEAIESDQNGYIPTGGKAYIRDILGKNITAQYPALGAYKEDFDVVITSGVTGALYCSLLACCDYGEDVLLPDPYFSPYLDMIKLSGCHPVFVNTYPNFEITAEKIEKYITSKTRLLILNSPNNPTGHVISHAELKKIIELCDREKITIISDEIYGPYAYNVPCSLASLTNNAIILKGFSKSHGASGWRIGYAIAPVHMASLIEKIQGKIYVSAPSITHHSIPAALRYDYSSKVTLFKKRRDAVLDLLSRVFPDVSCDGGMFIFFDVSSVCKCSASDFVREALQNGVALLPGCVFSQYDTHCRITLTLNLEKLLSAARIINTTAKNIRERMEL
ncbi:MAG: aminotransferase class [Gammaproteobacteria bacterium]|jgi:aspartate aminotransferase/aminotransferase|nr:aminotransferase class [Gammaproteobacteria bacterium]